MQEESGEGCRRLQAVASRTSTYCTVPYSSNVHYFTEILCITRRWKKKAATHHYSTKSCTRARAPLLLPHQSKPFPMGSGACHTVYYVCPGWTSVKGSRHLYHCGFPSRYKRCSLFRSDRRGPQYLLHVHQPSSPHTCRHQ